MTILQAIKETWLLWDRILTEGLRSKPETIFLHDCPCCQYVFDLDGSTIESMHFHDCTKCPLFGLWGSNCQSDSSVFSDWEGADTKEEQTMCAKIIRDFAKNLYLEEKSK